MANSEQDKQVDGSFDDDLDKMLQDTAGQMNDDQEELDSDDAIDRLLGDSQNSEALGDDFSESVDDLVDSLLDGVVTEQGRKTDLSNEEVDEFAEDEPIDDSVEALLQEAQQPEVLEEVDEFAENSAEPEVSEVEAEGASNVVAEPSDVLTDDEMSAFADDLLAEKESIDSVTQEKPTQEAGATEGMTEIDEFSSDTEDDFLLADFDISADEEVKEEVELATPDQVEQVDMPEPNVVPERAAAVVASEPSSSGGAVDDQSKKIAQIESELADLKLGANFSEALDQAVKEQKRANRELNEASNKLKVWSIAALVVGVAALVVGIIALVLNSGVQSSVERVQGSVMDIEDRLAVPAIKLVDPNDAKIEELQFNVQSMQALVNDMPERLNALQGQMNSINTEEIQQVVGKQLININEKLAALEVKVASLKGVRARSKASSRKVVKRVVVQEWVVNLVSFKQRWYTDKKVQEYKQKGIPVEVVSVDVQGVEWFRVRVAGFKDKAEAAAYAIKMKKSLNLNSIWVSKK
mgnify:CR=1 FL=1